MLFRIGDFTGCDHGRDGINCVDCAIRWNERQHAVALAEANGYAATITKLYSIKAGNEPYPNPDGSLPTGPKQAAAPEAK